MLLRNDFGQYPVADPEWEMRGIHPHRHTAIFAIEKYRQSLACLALCLENCYNQKPIFGLKMHRMRLATGLHSGPQEELLLTALPRPLAGFRGRKDWEGKIGKG